MQFTAKNRGYWISKTRMISDIYIYKVVASFFITYCLRKQHDWLPWNFRSTRGWPLPLFVSRFPGNLRSLASVIRPKTFLQASRGCQSSRSYCTGIREEWPLPSGAQGAGKSYLIGRRIHFDGLLRHAREFEFLMRKQKNWIAKFCASKEA